MSIVDLAKARAFADVVAESEAEAADWIRELCDEVESQEAALELSRRQYGEMKQLARDRETERDQAMAGLQELHRSIAAMLREARHIVDNHPEPAASAAALRIMNERTP